MALVELVRCDSRVEASILQAALAAAGIESFVFDGEMSWIGGALQARVMVDDDDLSEAERIMRETPPAD